MLCGVKGVQVSISQAIFGQFWLSPRLNSHNLPPESTNIFKRVFAEKHVEVVFSKSQLRGGKTSGRSPQTICERSPTSKSLNKRTQAHICLDAIVGFGLDPGEGKHLQAMKGWSDEENTENYPVILGKKVAGPHMVVQRVSKQKRDLRPLPEQPQGPQVSPPAFALPCSCTRTDELA